ncbi:MAG: hypothetical protein ACE5I1_13070, partial [bacterium]
EKQLQAGVLKEMMWRKREIENYLPIPEVLERYIQSQPLELFTPHRLEKMQELIRDYIPPAALRDRSESWWNDTKMSDDFLDKIFRKYFSEIKTPVLMDKSSYYQLALLAEPDELDAELTKKLDAIYEIANKAENRKND